MLPYKGEKSGCNLCAFALKETLDYIFQQMGDLLSVL